MADCGGGGAGRTGRWMPTRNQVERAETGARLWRGAFANRSDRVYADVAVEIRFLDPDGRPVGVTRAGAERLAPGGRLDLQAPLPPEAAGVQVWALRWRAGELRLQAGPYERWALGVLQG